MLLPVQHSEQVEDPNDHYSVNERQYLAMSTSVPRNLMVRSRNRVFVSGFVRHEWRHTARDPAVGGEGNNPTPYHWPLTEHLSTL